MHQKHGITLEELIRCGRDIHRTHTFENKPYMQNITIVGNRYEWDAVMAFLNDRDKLDGVEQYGDEYQHSGAYTLKYVSVPVVHTVIGFHSDKLLYGNEASARNYIGVMAHEIQHALIGMEREFKINSLNEEEPRAYSTQFIIDKALQLMLKQYHCAFVATYPHLLGLINGLHNLPVDIRVTMPVVTALSGMRDAYMTQHQHTVVHDDYGWSATTYTSGGSHE